MFENKILRLTLVASTLLLASLACNLNSITVDCSETDLIDAINQANTVATHTTLELASGCTYLLTAVDNTATFTFGGTTFEHGDNGLPQISTPITINGNNATIIRASGAPSFRFFFINDTGSLTINNLTLQNGFADGSFPGGGGSALPGSGGAIYNLDSYLEVNDSTLRDNDATFHAGAIFSFGGATTTYVNGSTIHDNEAPRGGGIFVYHGGLLSVDNSEISNNSSLGGGGGISLEHGAELILNDSLIASNHSGTRGGGIFKDSGSARLPTTITGTTFQDNTADWSGGGVFIWRTALTISDSQFSNNHANEYGGGLGYQNNSTETVLISNTSFNDNSATLDGGAVHFSGELMSINNSTIQDNLAENGAGIHNGPTDDPKYINRTDTTLTITSSTLQDNIASGDGGGAFNEGVMTCGESSFVGNESFSLGGGIHNTGEVEVVGCTFDNNETGFDGGGINSNNLTKIRASLFTNNTSTRGGGFASIGGDAEISDSTFISNSASDRGGGIFNFGAFPGSARMDILGCEINGNTAPLGGGVATTMGDTKISDSTFSDNEASSEGGGIFNDGGMQVFQSILSGNTASTMGGGIHNIEEIEVRDSTFAGNLAVEYGGGLNSYDIATITGSTFVGNTAFGGGGLASVDGDTTLTNNTFSANTATDSGGGILNMGSLIDDTPLIGIIRANHITVGYNSAPTGGGIAAIGGKLNIKNSIVAYSPSGSDCHTSSVNFSGIGENIDTDGSCTGFTMTNDPLLDTLGNNGGTTETHALLTGSPAIDAAADCTTIGGAPVSVDQRGEPRPQGASCDLGAYEAVLSTLTLPPLDSPSEPPTPELCVYTALQNTHCRVSDYKESAQIAIILEGETAELISLNPEFTHGKFELQTEQACWIWLGLMDGPPNPFGTCPVSVVDPPPRPADPPTPITCTPDLNQADCEASGGTWPSGVAAAPRCVCPE